MTLRFYALLKTDKFKIVKKTLVFLLMIFFCPVFSQNSSSPEDLKKEADKLFKNEEYTEAYKFYSQLVSNFPKDPEYNYRLGVCMIYSESDKKKCIPYLKFAASNSENTSKEVKFYLGKAYHINYLFDDAIKNYNEFKTSASASLQKKLQVDREIKACAFGKHLLSNLTDLVILNKNSLPESDYFRSYKKIGGKLLVKPEEFKTSIDKKKKEKSVVFLPNGSNVVYFSSYGENADNGKDIYTAAKLGDGSFGKPEKVKGINTEFDEDYPFLHPNGKTLYFASKGHNSMGGYDIFKSTYNEETNTWEQPINLEFPINSPDDDYLFVTDSLEKIAYFSTGRQSPPGKIDVLRINTERKPIDILVLKGSIIKGSPDYSLNSKINVKDLFTQDIIGNYQAQDNGNYKMELPNGAKLLFTLETPGLETQSAQVTLPMASVSKPYKQTISYANGKLKILNYFDEQATDESYLEYLDVIENKAKLDVNTDADAIPVAAKPDDAPKTNEPPANDPGAVTTTLPTAKDPNQGLDNKQLAKMAKQDALESRAEASQLSRDSKDATETGLKQKEEADKEIAAANEALLSAEAITNEDEKKSALEKAHLLKQEAENDQTIASRVLAFGQSLEEDSKNKAKEADLNEQYADELEKASKSKKNSQESLAKLEDLQKQISDLSNKKKESESVVTNIKTNIEEKEKQVANAEQINTGIKSNLEEIKTAINEKESELSKAKKKDKKNLTTQISELKTEQEEKEKQIVTNDAEIKTLNEELSGLKSELEIANKIKTEDIAVTTTNKPASANSQKNANETLQDKYKDKIVIADPQNKSNIEESTIQLTNFNKEIDDNIKKLKTDLVKTKNQTAKQRINNDLKQLETSKKQNLQQITANTKQLEILNNAAQIANKNTFDPITATSDTEAVGKLETLNKQLNVNDNENFDFNAYQNPKAQSLKVEADTKINDAIAKQKKLKDEIGISKDQIEKGTTGSVILATASSEQLTQEAEDILKKSQDLRAESKTKKGAEKEKLINESKDLEDKANDKFIQASDVRRNDNSSIVATNQENIQNLIQENKSSEEESKKAKKLDEEAKLSFRKASEMRTEANSINSKGAKLGNLSNAEEKEAEAISKQQQAIDLLLKSHPDFKLKKPELTSSSPAPAGTEGATDLNSKLLAVNTSLSELAAIKIESYQKLYEANDSELEQLSNELKNNQGIIDSRPSLKTDLISGTNKIEDARVLKQNSETATNPNEKLNNLLGAVKKQNAAIKQLSPLSASVNQIASNSPNTNPTNSNVNTTGTPTETTAPNDFASLSQIDLNTPTQTTPASVPQAVNAIDTKTVDISTLALQDTTTEQVINYFDNNVPALRNQQAGASVSTSISHLKDLEAQNRNVTDKLTKLEQSPDSAIMSDPAELQKQVDNLLTEADQINNKAAELKKESEGKKGEDKNFLLAKSREQEIIAQDKMIEAADIKQQTNENIYNANSNAITELLDKLKIDNPDLASQLSEKRSEYAPVKKQIRNLRDEANALSSKPAKLGAISNAEEKELELIQKQTELLTELKKQYPDYVVKPMSNQDNKDNLYKKKTQLREKQYTELTDLTNAFTLEYESSKNSVLANLSPEQQSLKQNADDLNAESKRFLIRSVDEQDENEKIKLLTLAAKSGNKAVEQLNKLLPKVVKNNDFAALDEIGNQIAAERTSRNNGKAAISIEGLEVVKGNAYSNTNPIPMNSKIEDGLIFRVQIGAFKTQLPNNAFRGLSPLNGETTPNGYFRYTAGNFNKIENANAVKNDLRGLGYSDAFVVVYYNGKRITLAEAMDMMNKEGKTIDPNAPQTAGITANTNVPKAAVNTAIQEAVFVTKELEKIDGLLYTVQIGVYTKQITKPQLLNLRPIFTEPLANGLFRYTAGIYNNPDKLLTDKQRVVDLGVKDAFVSAYLNGKRIPFADAKDRQKNESTLKMEPENPIIFPAEVSAPIPNQVTTIDSSVEPFKNGVVNYPNPTDNNGVKNTEEGVCFKVQIGAFSKQIPADVAEKFYSIRTWPVENKQVGGLFIYNVGNFSEAKFAKALKDEIMRLGITDAFITVYKDGKKLYGSTAEAYLR